MVSLVDLAVPAAAPTEPAAGSSAYADPSRNGSTHYETLRRLVETVDAPLPRQRCGLMEGGCVVITDDGRGIADVLADRLERSGIRTERLGGSSGPVELDESVGHSGCCRELAGAGAAGRNRAPPAARSRAGELSVPERLDRPRGSRRERALLAGQGRGSRPRERSAGRRRLLDRRDGARRPVRERRLHQPRLLPRSWRNRRVGQDLGPRMARGAIPRGRFLGAGPQRVNRRAARHGDLRGRWLGRDWL